MHGLVQSIWIAVAVVAATPHAAAQRLPDRRQTERADQVQRLEGQAILALADAVMAGRPVPTDFALEWHNDYLKAQQGTFIPFVLTFDATKLTTPGVLLYIRAVARRQAAEALDAAFPFEDIFPIEVKPDAAQPVRIVRGFLLPPGEYELCVAVRERADPRDPDRPRRAAVLRQPLDVPDFWVDELMTSTVILADRLTVLREPVPAERLRDRPYVIGLSDIQPAVDRRFRRDEELVVVFLVYNPALTEERKFDLEVEYHFYRGIGPGEAGDTAPPERPSRPPERPGEKYFNHTKPQRLTPAIMGPHFDPGAGQPVMAGQGVPLSGFPEGQYRLAIRVTDIIAGKTITRDVAFTVTAAR